MRKNHLLLFTLVALLFAFSTHEITAQPVVGLLSAPADLDATQNQTPNFSWAAATPSAGSVNYVLEIDDTDATFGSIIYTSASQAGTSLNLPAGFLSPGATYFWRVTATDDNGPSLYVPFSFTTLAAPFTLAVPSFPADAALGVSKTVLLDWTDAAGGTAPYTYDVEIFSDAGLTTSIYSAAGLVVSQEQVPAATLSPSTQYWWVVKSYDASPANGYSSVFTFTTAADLASGLLLTPANSAILQSLTPTFTWNTATGGIGAYSYVLKVYADAGLTSFVYASPPQAGTSFNLPINTLAYNTQYYWIVESTDNDAPTASTVTSATFTFVTLLATPALSGPADGFVSSNLTPNLTWTMSPSTSSVQYDVYVEANNPAPALLNGTVATLNYSPVGLAAATKYFWKVTARVNDVLKLNNGETKTSGIRHFYTDLPLLTPYNGLTGVAVEPTFTWTDASFESEYELRVSTSGASQVAFDANVVYTDLAIPANTTSMTYYDYTEDDANPGSFPFPLNNNTTYYWQVVAKDGLTSVPSAIWHFTTIPAVTINPNWPSNGALVYTDNTMFTWSINQAVGTMQFKFQVKASLVPPTELEWSTPDFQVTTSNLFYSWAPTGGTKYYWRVVLLNAGNEVLGYSPVRYFTTSGGAVSVNPSYPTGGHLVYESKPTFYWYIGGIGTNLTYDLEVSLTNFGAAVYSATNINALYHTAISNLQPGLTHWWRVRSVYKRGTPEEQIGAWSIASSFKTNGAGTLVQPINSYPTGGVTVYTTAPYLYWYLSASSSGLVFDIEIQPLATPFTGVPTYNDVADLFVQASGLTPGASYHWRVRSDNGSSTSTWSTPSSFLVNGGIGTSYPVASWPVGNPTVYDAMPSVYWYLEGGTFGLTKYTVRWKAGSTSANWNTTYDGTADVNDLNQTFYTFAAPLNYGTTYYWAVASYDGTTYSAWSEGSFTLAGGPSSGLVALTYPIGGVTVYSSNVDLYWYWTGSTAGIQGFEVVYSNSDVFFPLATTTIAANVQGTNTFASLTGLTPGATYFWKVRAWYGGASYSSFSATEEFTIDAGPSFAIQPRIGGPTNNLTINTSSPVLSWMTPSAPSSKLAYELEVADNAKMENSVTYSGLDSPSYKVSGLEENKEYFWRVRSKTEGDKYSNYSGVAKFKTGSGITAIEEESAVIPTDFKVEQNYPNPFNPSTTIKYALPMEALVTVRIYNMLGQEIKTLVNNNKPAGSYSVMWNGDDNFGNKVSSGAYIYTVKAGEYFTNKKMLLIK